MAALGATAAAKVWADGQVGDCLIKDATGGQRYWLDGLAYGFLVRTALAPVTLTETLGATDSTSRATTRTFVEAAPIGQSALVEEVKRDLARALTETASLVDAAPRSLARTIADSAGLADAITRDLARDLAESMGYADALARDLARVLVDAYVAADGRLDDVARILADLLSLSDTIVAELIVLFGRIARPRVALLSPLRTVAQASPIRTVELS